MRGGEHASSPHEYWSVVSLCLTSYRLHIGQGIDTIEVRSPSLLVPTISFSFNHLRAGHSFNLLICVVICVVTCRFAPAHRLSGSWELPVRPHPSCSSRRDSEVHQVHVAPPQRLDFTPAHRAIEGQHHRQPCIGPLGF